MRSLAVFVTVVLVSASGCSNKEKKRREALAAAQAEQTAALTALRATDTRAAVDHFHEAVTRIEKLRRSTAPPMSEDPGEGPVVDGLTAKQWQARWAQEFKDEIETQLPALLAATRAGKLDWNSGRALLTAYRPDLDARWLEGAKAAAEGEVAQRTDAYHLRCATSFEDICKRVRPLLEKKFSKPLDDKVLLELAMEKKMFGAVRIEGTFDGYRKYADVKDPNKNEVFMLPARLEVRVVVETFAGTSSWDGTQTFSAEVEPPPAIGTSSLSELEDRHYDALFKQALAPLEAKPAQSVE